MNITQQLRSSAINACLLVLKQEYEASALPSLCVCSSHCSLTTVNFYVLVKMPVNFDTKLDVDFKFKNIGIVYFTAQRVLNPKFDWQAKLKQTQTVRKVASIFRMKS